MASYTHTSRAAFKSQLSSLLGDTDVVHFTDAELNQATNEALRVWNCAAQFFRERGFFTTTSGQTYYDLGSVLAKNTTYLLARTVTDRDLVDEITAHLIESVNGSYVWTGSEQFSLDDIANALQRRRDQFLLETGLVLTQAESTLFTSGQSRISLADSVIDVRRVSLKSIEGTYKNLWREDEQRLANLYGSFGADTGTPDVFCSTLLSGVAIRLAPVPQDDGYLSLITVNAGSALTPASSGTALGIPDDYAWVVKYGALAELFAMGAPGEDPRRYAYCERRWKEGIVLAKIAASILYAEVSGVPVDIVTMNDLDSGVPDWQDTALDAQADASAPNCIGVAGHNLIALYPVPVPTDAVTDGAYSVAVDVVRNAPVPASDSEYVEVGREHIPTLLAYARSTALFKQGEATFHESVTAYDELLEAATLHNARLRAQANSFESMVKKATKEREARKAQKEAA